MRINFFCLTLSQYTDNGPTSLSSDPIAPGKIATGVSKFFEVHWYDSTRKNSQGVSGDRTPDLSALEADALTTRPTRRCMTW